MVHIHIKGSPAQNYINGEGNVLVMVRNGQAQVMLYLRDIIDGWKDDLMSSEWKWRIEKNPEYLKARSALAEVGSPCLGTYVGNGTDSFFE
jgi:hypothetical protein